jgi:uncharacterized protein YecT (DUF1311 family)
MATTLPKMDARMNESYGLILQGKQQSWQAGNLLRIWQDMVNRRLLGH